MNQNKALAGNEAVIQFLNEKFGATCFSEQFPSNMVTLGGRRWWVVTSDAEKEFDLCIGKTCEKSEVIDKLKQLDTGLLVFRQRERKYFYAVYLINDLDSIAKFPTKNFTINWNDLYSRNIIYERGIVMDNEIIGFRKLRRCRLVVNA